MPHGLRAVIMASATPQTTFQVEAPMPLKHWRWGAFGHQAWWPKVADAAIEAQERITPGEAVAGMILNGRSRTSGLRIMLRDRSRAVCVVLISQSSALKTHFQPFFQASWPTSERTSTTSFPAHQGASLLRPSGAVATVARDRAALLSASTHGRSIRPPSPGSVAATTWPSHCHALAQELVMADGDWHVVRRKALIGFQGLMLTWMSATLNGFIRPLKHNDFQEDAGRKNRVIRHGSVHDPGIQQEPRRKRRLASRATINPRSRRTWGFLGIVPFMPKIGTSVQSPERTLSRFVLARPPGLSPPPLAGSHGPGG
jgi:hypothetical protein